MIFISVGYFLGFSSLGHITNFIHYVTLKNWIYSIVARNSSTHLFRDDFDVCVIFSKLKPFTNGPNFFHNESLKSRFAKPCWQKTKSGVL